MNRSLCGTEVHRWTRTGPIVKRARTHALSLFFFGHILVSILSLSRFFLSDSSNDKNKASPIKIGLSLFLSFGYCFMPVVKVQPLLARSGQSVYMPRPQRNNSFFFLSFFLSYLMEWEGKMGVIVIHALFFSSRRQSVSYIAPNAALASVVSQVEPTR